MDLLDTQKLGDSEQDSNGRGNSAYFTVVEGYKRCSVPFDGSRRAYWDMGKACLHVCNFMPVVSSEIFSVLNFLPCRPI